MQQFFQFKFWFRFNTGGCQQQQPNFGCQQPEQFMSAPPPMQLGNPCSSGCDSVQQQPMQNCHQQTNPDRLQEQYNWQGQSQFQQQGSCGKPKRRGRMNKMFNQAYMQGYMKALQEFKQMMSELKSLFSSLFPNSSGCNKPKPTVQSDCSPCAGGSGQQPQVIHPQQSGPQPTLAPELVPIQPGKPEIIVPQQMPGPEQITPIPMEKGETLPPPVLTPQNETHSILEQPPIVIPKQMPGPNDLVPVPMEKGETLPPPVLKKAPPEPTPVETLPPLTIPKFEDGPTTPVPPVPKMGPELVPLPLPNVPTVIPPSGKPPVTEGILPPPTLTPSEVPAPKLPEPEIAPQGGQKMPEDVTPKKLEGSIDFEESFTAEEITPKFS